MITIEDIKSDMLRFGEGDAFYWDALNETAYHIHLYPKFVEGYADGYKTVCVKNTGKRIEFMSEAEFEDAVNNRCYGNSISADEYYKMERV